MSASEKNRSFKIKLKNTQRLFSIYELKSNVFFFGIFDFLVDVQKTPKKFEIGLGFLSDEILSSSPRKV